jgi:hypothetical protein
MRPKTPSTRNVIELYELSRSRQWLFERRFFLTFQVVNNSLLLLRWYLPWRSDGKPGRPLGISPDSLLSQGFQLGCEDRKLISRPRRYYRITLERQSLNVGATRPSGSTGTATRSGVGGAICWIGRTSSALSERAAQSASVSFSSSRSWSFCRI